MAGVVAVLLLLAFARLATANSSHNGDIVQPMNPPVIHDDDLNTPVTYEWPSEGPWPLSDMEVLEAAVTGDDAYDLAMAYVDHALVQEYFMEGGQGGLWSSWHEPQYTALLFPICPAFDDLPCFSMMCLSPCCTAKPCATGGGWHGKTLLLPEAIRLTTLMSSKEELTALFRASFLGLCGTQHSASMTSCWLSVFCAGAATGELVVESHRKLAGIDNVFDEIGDWFNGLGNSIRRRILQV
jgi:hypothetical protein